MLTRQPQLMNKFPHHSFHWEGLDGSTVLTHFPPGDTYNSQVSVKQVLFRHAVRCEWPHARATVLTRRRSVSNFKDLERSQDAMLLLGHGDGGGGAQMEMLERMKRMANLRCAACGCRSERPSTDGGCLFRQWAAARHASRTGGFLRVHGSENEAASQVER